MNNKESIENAKETSGSAIGLGLDEDALETSETSEKPRVALRTTRRPTRRLRHYQLGPSSVRSIFDGSLHCNLSHHRVTAGCTACVIFCCDDKAYVANAGDSRAVLCRGGVAVNLSEDHKPSQKKELGRIRAAGGFVNSQGRINGNLNLSRSIGDLKYKQVFGFAPEDQIITAEPDVTVTTILPEDEFILLACDGIWEVIHTIQPTAF